MEIAPQQVKDELIKVICWKREVFESEEILYEKQMIHRIQ